jgi:glycogen synthase
MSVRVLMLGWEFPPFVTGGLGTACYGLTKAMDRAGMNVSFVLPKAVRSSESSHVQILSPGLEMGEVIHDFKPPPKRKQKNP